MLKKLLCLALLMPLTAFAIGIKNNSDIKVQTFVEYQISTSASKDTFMCQHRPEILPKNSVNIHLADLCGLNTLKDIVITRVYVVADSTNLIENCNLPKSPSFENGATIIIDGGHEDDIHCKMMN